MRKVANREQVQGNVFFCCQMVCRECVCFCTYLLGRLMYSCVCLCEGFTKVRFFPRDLGEKGRKREREREESVWEKKNESITREKEKERERKKENVKERERRRTSMLSHNHTCKKAQVQKNPHSGQMTKDAFYILHVTAFGYPEKLLPNWLLWKCPMQVVCRLSHGGRWWWSSSNHPSSNPTDVHNFSEKMLMKRTKKTKEAGVGRGNCKRRLK